MIDSITSIPHYRFVAQPTTKPPPDYYDF